MTSIQRFVQITQAFDPEATRALGQAFDTACALLGHTPQPTAVREHIAKSIIEAAKAGERDPVRLRDAGLAALSNSNAAQVRRRHRPKAAWRRKR
jgi:plasmid stabilization system protein ParE